MHDQAVSLRGVGADLLSSSVPCLVVDRDGIVRDASPGVCSAFAPALNRSLAETLGIAKSELAEHLAGRGNRVLVGRSLDASGRIDPVLAQAVDLPANDLTLLILTDLGPSRRVEEARFQATPYPVLRLSPKGLILFVNQAAEETLGTDLH